MKVEREARSALVGRDRERALLWEALERAIAERESQLVTIVGVPGIGKSRLVYELFRMIEHGGRLIYWRHGRSLPYGEGVSFWALADMIKAHAGILESDDDTTAAERLRRAIEGLVAEPEERAWLQGHLRPLVGLEASSSPSSDRRAESFAAWRRFFEAMAEQRPLVLIFEDLHWAGDDLLDFVDHLVDWVSGVPLLVVATARLELLARRPAWSGGKTNALTVRLTPLGEEDSSRLVSGLLGDRQLPDAVRQRLIERAEGNPLYAEEFVRLVEEGREPAELPATVQGIIAARLDALPFDEKPLVRVRPSSARSSGSPRWRRWPKSSDHWSRTVCTVSSARTSCAASAVLRSPVRPSSPSGICSSAMSRTDRFRGPRGSTSILPWRAGSSRSAEPRITPRCLRTTTCWRSSSPRLPADRRSRSPTARVWPSGAPASGRRD